MKNLKSKLKHLIKEQGGDQIPTAVYGDPSPWGGIPFGSPFVPFNPGEGDPDTLTNDWMPLQGSLWCGNKTYISPEEGVGGPGITFQTYSEQMLDYLWHDPSLWGEDTDTFVSEPLPTLKNSPLMSLSNPNILALAMSSA